MKTSGKSLDIQILDSAEAESGVKSKSDTTKTALNQVNLGSTSSEDLSALEDDEADEKYKRSNSIAFQVPCYDHDHNIVNILNDDTIRLNRSTMK